MQIANLLHAQPAELGAAHRTHHVVAGAVVHLDDQHLAAGTRLDVVAVLLLRVVLTNTARAGARRTLAGGAGRIARLVGVPRGLAVVAEGQLAAGPFAADKGTGGASTSNDRVAAVGRRTPARVGVAEQHAAHHKVFVFGHGRGLAVEQGLDITGVHRFAALGTR